MTFDIDSAVPDITEALALYDAVGWSAYSREPETLAAALAGSQLVLSARTAQGRLVGLARIISDGATIAYLQDVLVHPEFHRQGIGGALLDAALARMRKLRQFVLLTDDEAAQRAFYESRALVEVHDVGPHPLRAFVRLSSG